MDEIQKRFARHLEASLMRSMTSNVPQPDTEPLTFSKLQTAMQLLAEMQQAPPPVRIVESVHMVDQHVTDTAADALQRGTHLDLHAKERGVSVADRRTCDAPDDGSGNPSQNEPVVVDWRNGMAKKFEDRVQRSLRLLADKPAHQLVDKPLDTITPLIERGHARVSRRFNEFANGKLWRCEEIVITDAGREALTK
jgi:hypothetical protein